MKILTNSKKLSHEISVGVKEDIEDGELDKGVAVGG